VLPSGWTSNNAPTAGTGGIYRKRPAATPPVRVLRPRASFKPTQDLSRISRAFHFEHRRHERPSFRGINTSTPRRRRYRRTIGQLSQGTATTPGAGTFQFHSAGARSNTSLWGYIFSNGATADGATPRLHCEHRLAGLAQDGMLWQNGQVTFTVDTHEHDIAGECGITTALKPKRRTIGNNVANGVVR
jgi:hypothetical protein